jgi:hypothetical protein
MEHIEPSYELPYVSTWGYFLDFEGGKIITNDPREDRKLFDQYPIYLKHTLYIMDEPLTKLRSMEINSRFFAQDELKEEGNWHYRKKNYYKALYYYEYALSALKWLEYHPTEQEKDMFPELEPKYKQYLAMFNDKNVKLFDGEDMEDQGDHDMRNSMLMTIYLNMSAAYIQSNHYTLALQVLDEAEKASGKAGSQIHYRRSQAITSNLASSL